MRTNRLRPRSQTSRTLLDTAEAANTSARPRVAPSGTQPQAAKKAKEYLPVSSHSREGLKNQLKFEGFTEEEAEYGVAQSYDI